MHYLDFVLVLKQLSLICLQLELESAGMTVFLHVIAPVFVGETIDPEPLEKQRSIVSLLEKEARSKPTKDKE